ncbi:MAG: hypothetical protein OHK0039_07780 [Bacteroidia bacterium]
MLLVLWRPLMGQNITVPPSGDNQRAAVTQYMGLVSVQITYNSPDVDNRRGRIWGDLVPYGLAPNNFGTAKAMPWRAGANENTVFEVSHDVRIQGKDLPAGTYSLHMIPSANGPWTLIFSRNHGAWGSYFYDSAEDALRVETTPEPAPYTEWLTYDFTDRQLGSCTAALTWEELRIPFRIEVPDPHAIYLARIRQELQNSPGFAWQSWDAAAQYCLLHNINLEEALTWSEASIRAPFIGEENFTTLSTYATLLRRLGRQSESEAAMDKAIKHPSATVNQIHQYGRQLLGQGDKAGALAIFEYNASRYPDVWPVNVGLARGYAAVGDFKKALKYAKIAQGQVPAGDTVNAASLDSMIGKLSQGQDIH